MHTIAAGRRLIFAPLLLYAVVFDALGRRPALNLGRYFPHSGHRMDLAHQSAEICEGQGLRAVALGNVRIRVHLDKQSVGACRNGGQCNRRNQVPFPSAMAGVGYDWQVT